MQNNKNTYSKQKHRLAIINIFLSPIILIIFIALGLPTYLKNISSIFSNPYINLAIFSALITLAHYLILSPMEHYSGFILEHKFSLSNQTFKDWAKREAKKGIVSFIISLPLIFAIYAFIKYSPLHWWLFTALSWVFISIIIAKFAPILIIPLFYKYSPINNAGLKDKLIKLSSKAGFKIEEVYALNLSKDTKKANAALAGMGRQKRILLCDTLLKNFNEKEIESVMGHELGHHKMKHILKSVLFGGVATVLIFFVTNIVFLRLFDISGYAVLYDFESLVLIYAIISVLSIFALPIRNAFSRNMEEKADEFTLKITGDKEAFISAMKKLADQNLADIKPGKFYEIMLYDHPPISRRISFAESFKRT